MINLAYVKFRKLRAAENTAGMRKALLSLENNINCKLLKDTNACNNLQQLHIATQIHILYVLLNAMCVKGLEP